MVFLAQLREGWFSAFRALRLAFTNKGFYYLMALRSLVAFLLAAAGLFLLVCFGWAGTKDLLSHLSLQPDWYGFMGNKIAHLQATLGGVSLRLPLEAIGLSWVADNWLLVLVVGCCAFLLLFCYAVAELMFEILISQHAAVAERYSGAEARLDLSMCKANRRGIALASLVDVCLSGGVFMLGLRLNNNSFGGVVGGALILFALLTWKLLKFFLGQVFAAEIVPLDEALQRSAACLWTRLWALGGGWAGFWLVQTLTTALGALILGMSIEGLTTFVTTSFTFADLPGGAGLIGAVVGGIYLLVTLIFASARTAFKMLLYLQYRDLFALERRRTTVR